VPRSTDFKGRVLLVNPWIHDFAAYNLWIEPLGLLTIGAVLRQNGYAVEVVDCLGPGSSPRPGQGTGKFSKAELPKPPAVAGVPRRYGRYGLPLEAFAARLAALPAPDLVLVASGMTYWYPGVVEAIAQVRERFGGLPVALGGVYATLCTDHARQVTGADRVIAGPGMVPALAFAAEVTGHDLDPTRYADPRNWPPPSHELVPRSFAGLLTSWGCPYRCSYCASHLLQPILARRDPAAVLAEVEAGVRRGIRDWAFYDDALLLEADRHLVPILEGLLHRGLSLRLHAPNGLHVRAVTPDIAALLHRAGLDAAWLSLETVDDERQRSTGGKVTAGAFEAAVDSLRAAGFGPGQVGAYILTGLPGQELNEVEATVHHVHRQGVQAKLTHFSPIPGTVDGDRALPSGADPLLHNKTVVPYQRGEEYVRRLQRLVLAVQEVNAALAGRSG
jgi:radical SAM superfamily enzyme YgiQ (UPF0313 family)